VQREQAVIKQVQISVTTVGRGAKCLLRVGIEKEKYFCWKERMME